MTTSNTAAARNKPTQYVREAGQASRDIQLLDERGDRRPQDTFEGVPGLTGTLMALPPVAPPPNAAALSEQEHRESLSAIYAGLQLEAAALAAETKAPELAAELDSIAAQLGEVSDLAARDVPVHLAEQRAAGIARRLKQLGNLYLDVTAHVPGMDLRAAGRDLVALKDLAAGEGRFTDRVTDLARSTFEPLLQGAASAKGAKLATNAEALVASLKAGDTRSFSAQGEFSAIELAGSRSTAVEIALNDQGVYTVSGDAGAELGLTTDVVDIQASMEARFSFETESPAEAARLFERARIRSLTLPIGTDPSAINFEAGGNMSQAKRDTSRGATFGNELDGRFTITRESKFDEAGKLSESTRRATLGLEQVGRGGVDLGLLKFGNIQKQVSAELYVEENLVSGERAAGASFELAKGANMLRVDVRASNKDGRPVDWSSMGVQVNEAVQRGDAMGVAGALQRAGLEVRVDLTKLEVQDGRFHLEVAGQRVEGGTLLTRELSSDEVGLDDLAAAIKAL